MGDRKSSEEATGSVSSDRLDSWKEIAVYLRRDVRTVRRWEKREGLPVRRHLHHQRTSVYAFRHEIDGWLEQRQNREDEDEERNRPRTRFGVLPAAAALSTVLLGALVIGDVDWLGKSADEIPRSAPVTIRELFGQSNREEPLFQFEYDVSPDGRFALGMAYIENHLLLVEVRSGAETALTAPEPHPDAFMDQRVDGAVFSPDGRLVAYGWRNHDAFDLRIVDVRAPDRSRVLFRHPNVRQIHPKTWTPDGASILAVAEGRDPAPEVVLVSASDGSERSLFSLDGGRLSHFDVSPDGERLAYDAVGGPLGSRDIHLRALGGADVHVLESDADDYFPTWTRDGQGIVFLRRGAGRTSVWLQPIASGKPKGAARLLHSDLGWRVEPLRLTDDGTLVYVLQSGFVDVQTVDLDPDTGRVASEPVPVGGPFQGLAEQSTWSPDGSELAFVLPGPRVGSGNAMTLVLRDMESGTLRTLHPELQRVQSPRWSPDGASFLVKGIDVHGRQGCFLVDRETGKVLQRIVELGPVAERCIWSPDGSAIYYDRIGPGPPFARILERDLSSDREREIFRAEFPSWVIRKYASPDGRFLACSIRDSRDESTSLILVPTDGSLPRELYAMEAPESPNAWGFSPDGRFVYFTVRKTNHVSDWDWELWRIATAGGEPEYLGLSVKGLRNLRVHPDGTKLAFTSGYGAKAVYALENFFQPERASLDDQGDVVR